jgi:hypothetical protein
MSFKQKKEKEKTKKCIQRQNAGRRRATKISSPDDIWSRFSGDPLIATGETPTAKSFPRERTHNSNSLRRHRKAMRKTLYTCGITKRISDIYYF